MSRRVAITRGVSDSIAQCELTHIEREPIDLVLARAQHRQYEACLADLGCEETGLQRLVRAGYRMLDLITFFTATGTKSVNAWAIQAGTLAPQAAGKVHSDMERGFIRAEVVGFEALKELGSFAAAREHGQLRVEGRDYVVRDGDIVHFRFNV